MKHIPVSLELNPSILVVPRDRDFWKAFLYPFKKARALHSLRDVAQNIKVARIKSQKARKKYFFAVNCSSKRKVCSIAVDYVFIKMKAKNISYFLQFL